MHLFNTPIGKTKTHWEIVYPFAVGFGGKNWVENVPTVGAYFRGTSMLFCFSLRLIPMDFGWLSSFSLLSHIMKNLMRLFFWISNQQTKLDNTWRHWAHVPKNTQGSDLFGSYCKDDGSQCGDSAAKTMAGKP